MTEVELREIVEELRRTNRDGQYVEAKKARTELPGGLRQTVSAFSNTNAGVILLGLDERVGFAATGVADPATMAAKLSDLCADQLEPQSRGVIEIHSIEGAELVSLEVPEFRTEDKPCFVRASGDAFVRVGDSDRRPSA